MLLLLNNLQGKDSKESGSKTNGAAGLVSAGSVSVKRDGTAGGVAGTGEGARGGGSTSGLGGSRGSNGAGTANRGGGGGGRGSGSTTGRAGRTSGRTSAASGCSAAGAGRGSSGGAAGARESGNTALDGISDTRGKVAGNARESGGDLVGDQGSQALGSSVLVLKTRLDLATGTSSDESILLGDEVVDGVLDIGAEGGDRGGEGSSIGGAEGGLALERGDTAVGDGDDVRRIGEKTGGVTAGVSGDIAVELLHGSVNSGDDGLESSKVTLDLGSPTIDVGRVGKSLGREAEGDDGGGELHFD
jgi:hypothetical protein